MAHKESNGNKFTLTVAMTEPDFWRFNLYMACEMFNDKNERVDYIHKLDIVANSAPYPTEQPTDYNVNRRVQLDVPECAWARVVLYLIPFVLPAERKIDEVASLPMRVEVAERGKVVASYEIHANPWSGRRLDLELPLDSQYKIRGR